MQDYSQTTVTSNQPTAPPKRQYQKFTKILLVIIAGLVLILLALAVLVRVWPKTPPAEEFTTQSPVGADTESKNQKYVARLVYDTQLKKVVSAGTAKLAIPANVHTEDLGSPIKPKSDPNLFIYKVRLVSKDGIILKDLWYWAIKEFIQTDKDKISLYLTLGFVPEATISIYDENEVPIWSGRME